MAVPLEGFRAPQAQPSGNAAQPAILAPPLAQRASCTADALESDGGSIAAELRELDPNEKTLIRPRQPSHRPSAPSACSNGQPASEKVRRGKRNRSEAGAPRRNFITHNFSRSGKRFSTGAKSKFVKQQRMQRKARWRADEKRHQPPSLVEDELGDAACDQPDAQSQTQAMNGAGRMCFPQSVTRTRHRAVLQDQQYLQANDPPYQKRQRVEQDLNSCQQQHKPQTEQSNLQWHEDAQADQERHNNVPATVSDANSIWLGNLSSESLHEALRRLVGYEAFRGKQEDVVRTILSGSSCLAVLSTAGGKSLCYQMPACAQRGMTVVVCPLIALMEEQLARLPESARGAILDSGKSQEHASRVASFVQRGEIDVLFLSPERFSSNRISNLLSSCPRGVSLVCVDEAHCVSEWSHNFRPSYFRLGSVITSLPGPPPILALTATATKTTQASIMSSLRIPADQIVRDSPLARNIRFSASNPISRDRELLRLLAKGSELSVGSVIVYCGFRAQCEQVATSLNGAGIKAASYHAGLRRDQRESVQKRFASGHVRVCVATVAFGMGLDKRDVRAVVHYSPPRSPEGLVQQSGRAGRDGDYAVAHLIVSKDDYVRSRSMAYSDCPSQISLLELLHQIFNSCKTEQGYADAGEFTDEDEAIGRGCLPVDELTKAIDVSEENMSTVLCYLEQWGYVRILQELMGSKCALMFHSKSPEALAEEDDIAAAVMRLSNGKHKSGRYTLPVLGLARETGLSLHNLQSRLSKLVSSKHMSCELKERALAFDVLEQPTGYVKELAEKLSEKMRAVERSAVAKLDATQEMITSAAAKQEQSEQERIIRDAVDKHFEAGGDNAEEALEPRPQPPVEASDGAVVERGIKADAATVIRLVRERGLLRKNKAISARCIARVLHGVGSFALPAKTACKAFQAQWGKHMHVDFRAVERVAQVCLDAEWK